MSDNELEEYQPETTASTEQARGECGHEAYLESNSQTSAHPNQPRNAPTTTYFVEAGFPLDGRESAQVVHQKGAL